MTALVPRIQAATIWLIRVLTVAAWGLAVWRGQVEPIVVCSLAIVLVFLPEFIEQRYKVSLPLTYSFTIVLFIYSSMVLGSVSGYYERFWWWDAMLHTSSGIVLGFTGFLILYVLYIRGRLKASLKLIAVLSFCFGLALGALWEIFEFGVDVLLDSNMQPSLRDTMWDLIVDSLGAAVTSLLGYRFLSRGNLRGFAELVASFLALNPRLKR